MIMKILNEIEMKYYVFCDDTHDGGRLEKFETLDEAREYMKKDSNAEQIILGVDMTNA